MIKLTSVKGAWPYLIAVFLNAFVDLGHKITIQNSIFKSFDGQEQILLTSLVNGLILIPFIILLTPAGFISDRYPKNKVIRMSSLAAVFLSLAITYCYYMGQFWLAFGMTFLLAVQSALYSPAKFGYIKGLFGKENLARANGVVQAVSIVAILSATVLFSLFFEKLYTPGTIDPGSIMKMIAPLGWLLVFNSVVELIMAYRLPDLDPKKENKSFDWKAYRKGKYVKDSLSPFINYPVIRLSIIGLSMFWAIGQMLLASFPAYAKEYFDVTNTLVIQATIASTGIGIALGSWYAARVSKQHIETGLIPIGAMGIAISLFVLPMLNTSIEQGICFLVIGVMGGLFIVPLNALIQYHAKESEIGKVLSVNNWVQNIAMASFLVATAMFSFYGLDSVFLLNFTAVIALIGGLYTIYKLPQSLVRLVISWSLTRRYRVFVQGMEKIPSRKGVLLLGNHISWVDWAIIQIACPRNIRFVMDHGIYSKFYLKWFLKAMGCVPVKAGTASLKTIAGLLDEGELVVLFPEGAISRTGNLGEFKRGFEFICKHAAEDLKIVPFYIRGLWGSRFSRSTSKFKALRKQGSRRDVVVAFGDVMNKESCADMVKRRVFDLSEMSWQKHVETFSPIANEWIKSVKRTGAKKTISDTLGQSLSGQKALVGAIGLSKFVKKENKSKNIGILMPTSAAGMIANMSAILAGKTVININYTSSMDAVVDSLEQAEIKNILTSKRFVKKLKQKGFNADAIFEGVNLIYLEDLSEKISKYKKILLLIAVKALPASILTMIFVKHVKTNEAAAILFSSGSEGAPKGVILSHQNIIANLRQISDVINVEDKDVILASLPFFHAFGLCVTFFLPLIEGIPLVAHADPTDAAGIGKAVSSNKVTIMCGTSTFLRLYSKSKKVHKLMFESLRVVVAGAERLNHEVRDGFERKFNVGILEGYGCTETSPVASVNFPDQLDSNSWTVQGGGKNGTVGMPLPGTSFKIVDPNSFVELSTDEAGMILIGGPQIMIGYLNNEEKTSEVIKQINGQRWYVTGDKGYVDNDGFLTIVDRYSRFAKLGGEMISLSSVEKSVADAFGGDIELVAVNIPDFKKGEIIILLHNEEVNVPEIKKKMIENGCSALMIPSKWFVADIPKLGSGKIDFFLSKKMASDML